MVPSCRLGHRNAKTQKLSPYPEYSSLVAAESLVNIVVESEISTFLRHPTGYIVRLEDIRVVRSDVGKERCSDRKS